ncbi:NAD(P)/FAD-dependent oxidoreductase [bacterium]|nr:NAD(P)/FAD-dependent oxidoreductase [bacterium]
MKNHYDVVVIGAGPAGAMAARSAAETGAQVLLLEKDRVAGIPVRCAEGVGEGAFRNLFPYVPESWICQRITKAVIHAPSGAELQIASRHTGLLLDRKQFDFDLAHQAVQAGAELFVKANVYGLHIDKVRGAQVQLQWLNREVTVTAKVVVGADGVESRVGRWGGLKTVTPLRDLDACAQVLAGPVDLPMDTCHFYFSEKETPGGYAWIFPKGNGLANIGLGVSGDRCANARPYAQLQAFLHQRFPGIRQLSYTCGAVPCCAPMKKIVNDRLMLAGDAAHQVNPLTGGGIVNALIAGRLAGKIAGQAVQENDCSAERLREYEKTWQQTEGVRQARAFRLKQAMFSLDDDRLNLLADTVLNLPFEKRTIINIFKHALLKKPSLIWDAVKVFT